MRIDKYLQCFFLIFVFYLAGCKQEAELTENSEINTTWSGIDALGRKLLLYPEIKDYDDKKYVGIFYFTWHGAHGYDKFRDILPNEGVQEKLESDTVSPYNISKIIAENPENPEYGPNKAFHYWNEPYFGYYLMNDPWVIKKHAQMLSDADIDVIILDITNTHIYLPQVIEICKNYLQMRKDGIKTPYITFLANTDHVKTVTRIYNEFYAKNLYPELWFRWKGKPLLLSNSEGLSSEIMNFFTLRHSWAWSDSTDWFGNGKDKWTWLDHYPQNYGWHDSPKIPEQISVCVAQHPTTNIGRSFQYGKQPDPEDQKPELGLCFSEQWKRALEVDPEFIIITGWNEWIAFRFNDIQIPEFLGKPFKKGDSFFVDLYNDEYSRDIEPVKSGLKDNYYMQMVNFVRKYKGGSKILVSKSREKINIDGRFKEWQTINPRYSDDQGDAWIRDHSGWGRITKYENTTARNDLTESRVAITRRNSIAFYIKSLRDFKGTYIPEDLCLLISNGDEKSKSWEGFNFIINRKPTSESGFIEIEKCLGDWKWENVGKVKYSMVGNELELEIPLSYLAINSNSGSLDFKWTDNISLDGDIMKCYNIGDSAPNGRFCYRFIYDLK